MGKLLSGGIATDKEGTLVDKTDLPQAKKHYLQVLQIDPGHTKALYNLANILSTEQNYEAAKKHLLNALEVDGSYSKAHYLLAHVYVECGMKEKAKEHFLLSSRTLPTMPWPTSGWASFFEENEMEKAAEHLRQSVAVDANHAEANFYLAMILRSDDDPSLAKKHFSSA